MDKDKIKKMSKQEVMEALERLTSKPTNKNMKSIIILMRNKIKLSN